MSQYDEYRTHYAWCAAPVAPSHAYQLLQPHAVRGKEWVWAKSGALCARVLNQQEGMYQATWRYIPHCHASDHCHCSLFSFFLLFFSGFLFRCLAAEIYFPFLPFSRTTPLYTFAGLVGDVHTGMW